MRIVVNGQEQEVAAGLSVTGLLDTMALDPRRVAVERNTKIVRRADFDKTPLTAGDTLEIVTLVGGG